MKKIRKENSIAGPSKELYLLGIPVGIHGEELAPEILKDEIKSLKQTCFSLVDLSNITKTPYLLHDSLLSDSAISLFKNSKNEGISCLSKAELFCDHFYKENPTKRLLCIGGDELSSYPPIKSWMKVKSNQEINSALIQLTAVSSFLDLDEPFITSFEQFTKTSLPPLTPSLKITFSHSEFSKIILLEDENLTLESLSHTLKDLFSENKIQDLFLSINFNIIDHSYLKTTENKNLKGLSPHQLCSFINIINSFR